MKDTLNENMRSTLKFTIIMGVILSLGIFINTLVENEYYTLHIFVSCVLRVFPVIITCFIVDDLYRLNTKAYRKDKLLVETFLLIFMILCSISYDFNLTNTILFLIIISYNFLLIVSEFVRR